MRVQSNQFFFVFQFVQGFQSIQSSQTFFFNLIRVGILETTEGQQTTDVMSQNSRNLEMVERTKEEVRKSVGWDDLFSGRVLFWGYKYRKTDRSKSCSKGTQDPVVIQIQWKHGNYQDRVSVTIYLRTVKCGFQFFTPGIYYVLNSTSFD